MEALIVMIIIGLIPAIIANKKGYNFYIWWIYGITLSIIAIIHSIILKPIVGTSSITNSIEKNTLSQENTSQDKKKTNKLLMRLIIATVILSVGLKIIMSPPDHSDDFETANLFIDGRGQTIKKLYKIGATNYCKFQLQLFPYDYSIDPKEYKIIIYSDRDFSKEYVLTDDIFDIKGRIILKEGINNIEAKYIFQNEEYDIKGSNWPCSIIHYSSISKMPSKERKEYEDYLVEERRAKKLLADYEKSEKEKMTKSKTENVQQSGVGYNIDPKIIISYSLYLRDGSCFKEGKTAVCNSDDFNQTYYYKCSNGKAYRRTGYNASWERKSIYDKACY